MSNTKKAIERKKEIIVGRVKELRLSKNLTQLEFGESIGVTSDTISRIEREETSLTSDIALKIADEYGVSLDWLFLCSDENLSPKRKKRLIEAFECMQEQDLIDEKE